MRIALLVPDGIGVRNYLFSNLLQEIKHQDVIVVHNLPEVVLQTVREVHPFPFQDKALPSIRENRLCDMLRRLVMFARLHRNAKLANNPSIARNYLFFYRLAPSKKLPLQALDGLAKMVAAVPFLFGMLERLLTILMWYSAAGKSAKEVWMNLNPDVVLCTHQRSVEAGYFMQVASRLGIRTIGAIFSWDNLPKSRMTFHPDLWLLWSKHMYQEFLKFYPKFPQKNLSITGTPQFDGYRNKKLLWKHTAFQKNFGLPDGRPALLFSGNEPSFPSDHLYLKDLLITIAKLNFDNRPFVIVRPSPADHTTRLDDVASIYPNDAIVARPYWKKYGDRDWESFLPMVTDSQVLVNLAYHCLCVINIGSTMAIDFAHFNKPAAYIRYNHTDCPTYNLEEMYQQEHLKIFNQMQAVTFIDSPNDWEVYLYQLLNNPLSLAPEKQRLLKTITDGIEDSTKKIAEVLQASY